MSRQLLLWSPQEQRRKAQSGMLVVGALMAREFACDGGALAAAAVGDSEQKIH